MTDNTDNQEPAQPPPCNPAIFRDGVRIFVTHTIRSFNLEPWVQRVAALSGQPVDWHYVGGRAVVLACGDVEKARAALVRLLPEHDALFRAASKMSERELAAVLSGLREYSGIAAA